MLSVNAEDDLVEVMNGCICCTVRGDLVQALKRLYAKIESFDAVIIETTGLADPAPVAQTFFADEDIQQLYKLDGICTLVDSKHVMQHLDEMKPEGVVNEAVAQVAFADRLILNKIDLIESDGTIKDKEAEIKSIEDRLRSINGAAPIIRCTSSKVDPKQIVNLDCFNLDRVLEMEPDFLKSGDDSHAGEHRTHLHHEDGNTSQHEHDSHVHNNSTGEHRTHPHHEDGNTSQHEQGHTHEKGNKHEHGHKHKHDDEVSSCSAKVAGEMNFNKVRMFIEDLINDEETSKNLFRYKGVLAVRGMDRKYVFQGVHMIFTGAFSDSVTWKADEPRDNRFVFIGRKLDKKALIEGFESCKAETHLRFSVGDEVQARTAQRWVDGVIEAQWDTGNPYRIQTSDRMRSILWAPIDSADYVRTPRKTRKRKTSAKAGGLDLSKQQRLSPQGRAAPQV